MKLVTFEFLQRLQSNLNPKLGWEVKLFEEGFAISIDRAHFAIKVMYNEFRCLDVTVHHVERKETDHYGFEHIDHDLYDVTKLTEKEGAVPFLRSNSDLVEEFITVIRPYEATFGHKLIS